MKNKIELIEDQTLNDKGEYVVACYWVQWFDVNFEGTYDRIGKKWFNSYDKDNALIFINNLKKDFKPENREFIIETFFV